MKMRTVSLIVGIVVALAGLVFFLQGINILPGSVMTGDPFWAWTGLILLIVGSIVALVGWRSGQGRVS
jgi:divalent metal cation (Fe/Co/Zn/Cd) transporter